MAPNENKKRALNRMLCDSKESWCHIRICKRGLKLIVSYFDQFSGVCSTQQQVEIHNTWRSKLLLLLPIFSWRQIWQWHTFTLMQQRHLIQSVFHFVLLASQYWTETNTILWQLTKIVSFDKSFSISRIFTVLVICYVGIAIFTVQS